MKIKMEKVLVLLVIAYLVMGIGICFWFSSSNMKVFTKSEKVLVNPMIGYAPRADYSEVGDVSLVYIDIYWSELEPQEGVYNWEIIEENYQFERWKAEGKHAVLRFVADVPSGDKHLDIPNWLYKKTRDGEVYNNSYGKGYSPNYSNPIFIKSFQKTLQAMGQRWGQDNFISYIELGVIGHWGEWHTNLDKNSEGIPRTSIRNQYVLGWEDAFPHALILLRRPFNIAAYNGYGLFNDVFGNEKETARWLEWIEIGGDYNETGEKDALTAMPDFWMKSASGGELTSSISMKILLTERSSEIIEQVRQAHTSFLGPHIADRDVSQSGYDELLKNLGYRLWISKVVQVSKNEFYLIWENSGVAPFYWDWDVVIEVSHSQGKQQLVQDFALSQIMPGKSVRMDFIIDENESDDWDSISIGIVDPMTQEPAVHLAIADQEEQTQVLLLTQEKD